MTDLEKYLNNKKFFQEGGRTCYFYPNRTFSSRAFKEHSLWSNQISIVSTFKNHKVNWYFAAKDELEFQYALERALKVRDFLGKTEKEIVSIVTKAEKKLAKAKLADISGADLFSLYAWYIATYDVMGMAPAFMRQIDRSILRRLRDTFKNTDNLDSTLAIAAYPTKMSYGRQEEVAICKAALKAAKNPKKIGDLAVAVANEFGTSSLGYYDEPAKDVAHYTAKITQAIKENPVNRLKDIKKEDDDAMIAKASLKKGASAEIRKIIDIAGRVVFSKDHYKFYMNRLQAAGEAMFQEIAKRAKLSSGHVKDFTLEEVENLLSGGTIDMVAAEKRTQNHAVISTNNGTYVLVGDAALDIEKRYLPYDESKSEFKGRIACRGKGTGKARVVLSPADFPKMHQGDVLVVMNTSPDFVPIMKKASAIVAEEGGITGHVSVVSREFNIPCIVGISRVTDIIKDGHTLEVDAEKGIVRILK